VALDIFAKSVLCCPFYTFLVVTLVALLVRESSHCEAFTLHHLLLFPLLPSQLRGCWA
jgi:hypothetical protein